MWRAMLVGAIVCAGIFTLSVSADTHLPDRGPGEAYTRVMGVEIDWVEIPPGADIPVERIREGYLRALGVAVAAGASIGALGGWLVWRLRRRTAR
jgi:hypothetical protein